MTSPGPPTTRRCTVPDCRTTLSEYNHDPQGRCWSHQERQRVPNTNPGPRIVAPERPAYDPRKGKHRIQGGPDE